MGDKIRGVEWKVTVVGIVLSVGLGVIFYVNIDLKAALATFAGLLGTTIALQLEMLLRERRTIEESTRQQRLVSLIENIPWLPPLLDDGLTSLYSFERMYGQTVVGGLSQRAFQQAVDSFRDLQHGQFETTYGDITLLYQLTENTRRSIHATSVENVDLDWWRSPAGERYWRLHEDALRRGVAVRRTFIYHNWTPAHEQVASRQHKAGATLFRVERKQLPPHLLLNLVLWDQMYGYESRANPDGEAIAVRYLFSARQVQRMFEQYEAIESLAEAWPPGA